MSRNRADESTAIGYETQFNNAVKRVSNEFERLKIYPTDGQKLKLYGLYKQATVGDVNTSRPGLFSPIERAKWDTWSNQQGSTKVIARRRYVMLVMELDPTFKLLLSPNQEEIEQSNNSAHENLSHLTRSINSQSDISGLQIISPLTEGDLSIAFDLVKTFCPLLVGVLVVSLLCIQIENHEVYQYIKLVDKQNNIKNMLEPICWMIFGWKLFFLMQSKLCKWNLFVLVQPVVTQRTIKTKPKPKNKHKELTEKQAMEKMGIKFIQMPNEDTIIPTLNVSPLENGKVISSTMHVYEYSFDQVVYAYFHLFKEPLPDPNQSVVVGLEIQYEHFFSHYQCRVIKRRYKLKNSAPYIIRRIFNVDFIYLNEIILLDERNKKLYTKTTNETMRNMVECNSTFIVEANQSNPNCTSFTKSIELAINGAFGMAFGMVKSFLENGVKNGNIKYHLHLSKRLEEYSQIDPSTNQ